MLLGNSVTYNNCDQNIYMLFKTLNNFRKKKCTRWGGFEIIPTNKIVPVSCYWAGSFRPRARCFFHGRPAQPAILEATRPIPWYQPRTGYAALRYEAVVGALGCDSSWPSSACIAFLYWQTSAKTILILAEEISLTFVPTISPFCTRSRGLVLNLKVPPTECISGCLGINSSLSPFSVLSHRWHNRFFWEGNFWTQISGAGKTLCDHLILMSSSSQVKEELTTMNWHYGHLYRPQDC